ncbi:MAG: glycosyltransferase family 39 protein [Candidatus Magasanikbacteria bacterium]|nr:glycosyltransferase family 39 protein [Candidatus Magasanikbacteria bacterium]
MFLKKHAAILSITLAGLTLRLVALAHYGDFWGDEMFSFVYSQKPWLTSLRFWTLETNPPLHMVFLKFWWYVFPETELFARLPSVIFGTVSIWAIYRFTQKLFTNRTAILAALLLALSPYHIFMSATARGYALFLLLAILSLTFFYTIFIAGETTRKNYVLFGLIALGLLYTHLTTLLLLTTEGLLLILLKRDSSPASRRAQNDNRWRALKKFFLTILPAVLLWLPWAVPAFYFKLHNPSFDQAWFFNIEPTFKTWLEALHPLFGAMNPPLQFILISVFFPILIAYALYQQKKKGTIDARLLFILLMSLVPVVAATGLGLWNIKFFVIAIPPTIILTAYLIDYSLSSHILATLILIGLTLPNLIGLTRFLPAEDWRTVNTFVAAHTNPEQKQLFVYTNFTDQPRVARYLKGAVPAIPYYPYDEQRWDEMVITKNYLRSPHPNEEMATWYEKNRITQYDELFVLQSSTLGNIDLRGWLEKNHWELKDKTTPRLVGDDYQLLYYAHY